VDDVQRRGISRRSLLISSVVAAGTAGGVLTWSGLFHPFQRRSWVLPGEPLALTPSGKLLDTEFSDPFADGQMLGYLPFFDGDRGAPMQFGQHLDAGHDCRQIIDVTSLLTPEGRKTPADQFFIRTEYPDQLVEPPEWTIKLGGLVKNPQPRLTLKSLLPSVESKGPILVECSGNARELRFGLLSVADWAGIPFQKIVQIANPTSKAKAVLINGFDEDSNLPYHPPPYSTHSFPTCSWIFPIEQLEQAGAFLATEMNGKPLPKDHGAPVRLVIPGWFGCTEVKWVNEITFVDNDQPATLQMLEFGGRTFQQTQLDPSINLNGRGEVGPDRAKDYRPATIG
jgi:DMSO/TMAO reductase YedYZ molybdopterin-dependent catalytic subunit